jgi:hypothetical protein
LFSQPANADSGCRSAPHVTPSSETRVIRNSQFGFRFSIPANYRTLFKVDKYDFGDVTLIFVLNPSEVDYLECLRKSRQPSEINSEAVVLVRPISSKGLDVFGHVKEIQKQASPRFRQELLASRLSTNIGVGTVAKQSAAIYNAVGMYTTRNAAFLTPDRDHVVSVSVTYGSNAEGKITAIPKPRANLFQQILDTFSFEK